MAVSQDPMRAKAASSRHAPAAPHHIVDSRKVREADARRMVWIGWLVAGGVALVTGIVLMSVMSTHDSRGPQWGSEVDGSLDELVAEIHEVDLNNEDSIRRAKHMITANSKLWRGSHIQEEVKTWLDKLNSRSGYFRAPRSLEEQLSGIEGRLAGAPTIEILGKDFRDVRDLELKTQSAEAGSEFHERYRMAAKEVTKRYLEALRTAANDAASATSGEALAPHGPLEDTLRSLLHEAMANKDTEATAIYDPMWKQTYTEINGIVEKLFNPAYQSRLPWTNLLTDTAGWATVGSSSFKHTFGAGLTLINAPGEQSASGGLNYAPADKWRDYVLEIEVKIDSGALVFYTRIGDKMDTKEVPGFTLGTKNATIQVEYSKTYNLVISTIGNQLKVTGEGIAWADDDIKPTKSRKGEPGIVAQPGTTATITKLRARHLR